jgi:putative Mg2+ transporter-C (MgtC) family protein
LDFLNGLDNFSDGGLSLADSTIRLGMAMILGVAVGIERARREQSAGMRTYAVVSMASALIMIVSIYGLPMVEGQPQDPGRIAAQVVSGIGFLGAGVIFMRRNVVHGLTTAASLWAVSGVGLAIGGGMLVTGTIATFFLLLISGGLHPVKKRLFHQEAEEHRVRLHLSDTSSVIRDIRKMATGEPAFTLTSLDLESTIDKKKTVLEIRIRVNDPDDAIEIVHKLELLDGVDRIGWHVGKLD